MKTFKDIKFSQSQVVSIGNLNGTTKFDNGFTLSVVAGAHAYSTPREFNLDPDFFSSFEIAIFNSDGDFVTKDFVPGIEDDVLGWQDRGQINALMLLIQSNVKVK
jgi:hypothetical protein